MTDREAFIANIVAHPDADLPRLVFADYLEENGEEPLAAFIRKQCEMARVPKWDPIWIHGCWMDRSWVTGHERGSGIPSVPGGTGKLLGGWGGYRRGLPWWIPIENLTTFAEAAERTFAQWPLGGLLINGGRVFDLRPLTTAAWFSRIERLDFWQSALTEATLQPLLQSEHATRLAQLIFRFDGIDYAGLRAVLCAPLGQQLREVRLYHNQPLEPGPRVEPAFIGCGRLPRLERLDLSGRWLYATAPAHILESLDAPKLNRLELNECDLGIDGTRLLANANRLKTVESLNLTKTNPGANGVKLLAASPNLGNLKVLKLRNNRLGPVAVKAMVAASWFAKLHVLDLGDANISDNGAKAIANSTASVNLRVLDLTRNAVTDPGAKALLDSPHLTSLIHLDLKENVIAPALLEELRKRFGGRIAWERVVSPKKKR